MPTSDHKKNRNLAHFHGQITDKDGQSVAEAVLESNGDITLFSLRQLTDPTYVFKNHNKPAPVQYRVLSRPGKNSRKKIETIGEGRTDGVMTSLEFHSLPENGSFIVLEALT